MILESKMMSLQLSIEIFPKVPSFAYYSKLNKYDIFASLRFYSIYLWVFNYCNLELHILIVCKRVAAERENFVIFGNISFLNLMQFLSKTMNNFNVINSIYYFVGSLSI